MTKTPKLTEADLRQFTGTERWYRHGLNRNVLLTEGAKYVADEAGAYWLLDAIATVQLGNRRIAAEPFQVWTLAVAEDNSAILACEDGNGRVVHTQRIAFTDFPAPGVTLWFENKTIHLPSER